MSYFKTCPRCDERGYEVLHTHSYCVNCNYSPDLLDQEMVSARDLLTRLGASKASVSSDQSHFANVIHLEPVRSEHEAKDFEGGSA